MTTIDKMIEKAEANAAEPGRHGYGSYIENGLQIYLIPVQPRTRIMRQHYRATFYAQQGPNGTFYRVNKTEFQRRWLEQEHKLCPANG